MKIGKFNNLDIGVDIHDGMVVWQRRDPVGGDWDVFRWDTTDSVGDIHQVHDDNNWDDRNASIHDGLVVWQRGGNLPALHVAGREGIDKSLALIDRIAELLCDKVGQADAKTVSLPAKA